MRRFLLLDDEMHVLSALKRAIRQQLGAEAVHIEIYSDPAEALASFGHMQFDLVISDLRMPAMSGVEFLKQVRERQPDAVRMMLSASTDFHDVVGAVNDAEIFRFVAKPWHIAELEETIRLALARRDRVVADRLLAEEMRLERGELAAYEVETQELRDRDDGSAV